MPFAGGVDFNAALNRKYDILKQQADANTTQANSGAYLQRTQADLMPGTAAAENRLRNSQAGHFDMTTSLAPGLAGADIAAKRAAAGYDVMRTGLATDAQKAINYHNMAGGALNYANAANAGRLADSVIGLQGSQVRENDAKTSLYGENVEDLRFQRRPTTQYEVDMLNQRMGAVPALSFKTMSSVPLGTSSSLFDPDSTKKIRMGMARGMTRVPGKSRTKDTTPAMLAKDEAVLNAPAADMAGRGMIATLNRLGAMKMGMT